MDWDDPIPIDDDPPMMFDDNDDDFLAREFHRQTSPPMRTDGNDCSQDGLLLDETGTPLSKIRRQRNRGPSADEEIEGVPKTGGTADNLKRFSFGVGGRRSISQPVLPVTPKARKNQPILSSLLAKVPVIDAGEKKSAREYSSTQTSSPQKRRGPPRKAPTVPDEFFGVYCLISRSTLKQYKNRCYIGYTVDPNRRIRQHNGGKEAGGAKKTDNRGPWDMVCIIHGFPNNVAALRFEWAWQNPEKSRALKGKCVEKKRRKETPFSYRLRIACHLMNSVPWRRLGLTFRWLLPTEELPFPAEIPPPEQVAKEYGLVRKTTTKVPVDRSEVCTKGTCMICKQSIKLLSEISRCLSCWVHYHCVCLASESLQSDHKNDLFPLEAKCRICMKSSLWSDVIRDQRSILRVENAQKDEALKGLVPSAEFASTEV